MKKVVKIIVLISLLLIISGLIVEIIMLNNKNNELDSQLEKQITENIKLRYENEALWDNYYMNTSEYGGEYYE